MPPLLKSESSDTEVRFVTALDEQSVSIKIEF